MHWLFALCREPAPPTPFWSWPPRTPKKTRRSPGERFAEQYEINMLRCIFCGYCEEACPTQAVQLKDICELADDNRKDLIYTKEMMLVPDPTL